jgi:hypothetical protein
VNRQRPYGARRVRAKVRVKAGAMVYRHGRPHRVGEVLTVWSRDAKHLVERGLVERV